MKKKVLLVPVYKFGKWSGCQADVFLTPLGYYAHIYGGGYKEKTTRFYARVDKLVDELNDKGFYMIKNYTCEGDGSYAGV